MTFGSLFAGIGGFDLGFERAGMKCRFQVEIDDCARRVLAHHWPYVLTCPDVRKIHYKDMPAVDVICGGFPCQDLSVAGQRAGLGGERSGLFHEMARIVDELQPMLLVWENVPGLLTSDSGRDFRRVCSALADIGYFGAWRTLDTQFFGAPQRRRRVFGVFACVDLGEECAAEILALTESGSGDTQAGGQTGQSPAATLSDGSRLAGTVASNGDAHSSFRDERGLVCGSVSSKWAKGSGGPAGDECYNLVSHTLSSKGADASEDGTGRGTPLCFQTRIARNGRGQPESLCPAISSSGITPHGDATPHIFSAEHGVRRLMQVECLRLQSFPDDWLDLDPPLSDSAKYRLIGNAVTVNVAEWIGRRIMATASHGAAGA